MRDIVSLLLVAFIVLCSGCTVYKNNDKQDLDAAINTVDAFCHACDLGDYRTVRAMLDKSIDYSNASAIEKLEVEKSSTFGPYHTRTLIESNIVTKYRFRRIVEGRFFLLYNVSYGRGMFRESFELIKRTDTDGIKVLHHNIYICNLLYSES